MGGVPGLSDKKSSDNVFLVLSLLWSCNFKEIYHFSRFQRGSNNFQGTNFFQGGGGVQWLILYRKTYNL